MLLADGAELTVRRATPDDLDRVVDLHDRCSLTSRLRRYLAGTRCPRTTMLARLLSPASGHSLVVEDADGRVIAMANLMWHPSRRRAERDAELALLIEDAWQQRRLGTLLARRLFAVAEQLGVARVRAVVHAGNAAMIRIMVGLARSRAPAAPRVRRRHADPDRGCAPSCRRGPQIQRLPSSIRWHHSAYGIELPT